MRGSELRDQGIMSKMLYLDFEYSAAIVDCRSEKKRREGGGGD